MDHGFFGANLHPLVMQRGITLSESVVLSSINEMIPAGLFLRSKIRLDRRREPKKCKWSFFVGSCLTSIAMNEISPVPRTRASWYAGQCEGRIWASSQLAEQGKARSLGAAT